MISHQVAGRVSNSNPRVSGRLMKAALLTYVPGQPFSHPDLSSALGQCGLQL